MVGPPRFKKRTPSPLLSLASVFSAGIDGADESDIPVAALSSVDRLSFLSLLLGVSFLLSGEDDDDGEAAKSRIDGVLATSLRLPQGSMPCGSEGDNMRRLASGIKAVVVSSNMKSDTSEASTPSL